MKRMIGHSIARVALLALATAAAGTSAASAQQQLSDNAVQVLVDYAWRNLPDRVTDNDPQTGQKVTKLEIDKKQPDKVKVPMDIAREVIMVGRLSAHAHVCSLDVELQKNRASMMARHVETKKYTPQQLYFINQLHFVTVLLLSGDAKVEEREGDKVVSTKERPKPTCTDEQRKKVVELIDAYVKAGPAIKFVEVEADAKNAEVKKK